MNLFYCLRFETPITWRARSPYLYPPGREGPSYILRHWVPFTSPAMALSITVEVFEPASTRSYGAGNRDKIIIYKVSMSKGRLSILLIPDFYSIGSSESPSIFVCVNIRETILLPLLEKIK
jgi:hypothetical protein